MSRLFRLATTATVATALLGAVALPASASTHRPLPRPQLAIGAVQYDSPGRDDRSNRSLNSEWVTVTNRGQGSVDLRHWILSDSSRHSYQFRNLTLRGHQSVRVHTGTGHDTTRDVYQDSHAYIWNNSSDTATLRDAHGRTIAVKSWGRGHR